MTGESFVVVMFAIVSATLIACLPVVLFFWLVLRKRSNRGGISGNEEEKLRHISSGLHRMEQRIENLETILAGRRRHDPLYDAARSEDVRTGRWDS